MSKMTSKRQVTVPKQIADRYGLGPGSEIDWVAEDDGIRIYLASATRETPTVEERLRWFDQATERSRQRQVATEAQATGDRGWTREELYDRGVPR
jgi:AbrB family looped-hinge helix DNA binding protein